MINKLASIFLPRDTDRSPNVPVVGMEDEEERDKPRTEAGRRAYRKHKEKYKYRTMDQQIEHSFSSPDSSVNSKEPRQHLTP